MAKTLQDFISKIRTTGLPLGNRFEVNISGAGNEDVMMLASSCSLPGLTHMTTEQRIFGEIMEIPYGIVYPPVTLNFIIDNDMSAKQYFDEWAQLIFNKTTRRSGYYRDYIRTVTLSLLNKNETPIYTVTLMNAFIKDMQEIQLSSESRDILQLPITLSYKYWVLGNDPATAGNKELLNQ